MQTSVTATDPVCPICGSELWFARSFNVPLTADPNGWRLRNKCSEEWEIQCSEGHIIAYGGPETDGRSAKRGWKRAVRRFTR